MAYCPSCDLLVETEFRQIREKEEAERTAHYYDGDVQGDWDLDEVGEIKELDNGDGSTMDHLIMARIDSCANCGTYVDVRTYADWTKA